MASTVVPQIRRDIVTGFLEPGVKIHIGRLCERYGVGLAPLREALNRLTTEGVVEQEDRHGFSVAALTQRELEDILSTRCHIDGQALRESIRQGDGRWEEELLLSHHRMTRVARGTASEAEVRRGVEWADAHKRFHESLVAACPLRWLLNFSSQLFAASERFRYIASGHPLERAAAIDDEHRAIMEAAIKRDEDGAVELLCAHYKRTADLARLHLST